jgi:hypothetical protein
MSISIFDAVIRERKMSVRLIRGLPDVQQQHKVKKRRKNNNGAMQWPIAFFLPFWCPNKTHNTRITKSLGKRKKRHFLLDQSFK